MQEIHDQVAADALAQYEMVAKSGTPTDKCVQAGLVAQAYLQAKREAEYDKWKLWQKMDCAVAGVPI